MRTRRSKLVAVWYCSMGIKIMNHTIAQVHKISSSLYPNPVSVTDTAVRVPADNDQMALWCESKMLRLLTVIVCGSMRLAASNCETGCFGAKSCDNILQEEALLNNPRYKTCVELGTCCLHKPSYTCR